MSFGTDYITKPLREKIEKLQEENKQLRKLVQSDEALEKNLMKEKLEAIRCVINDPPTYSIPFLGNPAPEVQDYRNRMDAWYCKLLNIAHTAQNTDYVQKEEAT